MSGSLFGNTCLVDGAMASAFPDNGGYPTSCYKALCQSLAGTESVSPRPDGKGHPFHPPLAVPLTDVYVPADVSGDLIDLKLSINCVKKHRCMIYRSASTSSKLRLPPYAKLH